MIFCLVFGYLGTLSLVPTHVQAGQLSTPETETGTELNNTATPNLQNWYVGPAILWSSIAAAILLAAVILLLCFFGRRWINGHPSTSKLSIVRKIFHRTGKAHKYKRKSANDKAELRTSWTDSVLTGRRPLVNSRAGSYRSESENHIFSMTKVNPVYECDETENIASKKESSDKARNGWTDVFESSGGFQVLSQDQTRAHSDKKSSASSLPARPAEPQSDSSHIYNRFITSPDSNVYASFIPSPEADRNMKSINGKDSRRQEVHEVGNVGCDERPFCCV